MLLLSKIKISQLKLNEFTTCLILVSDVRRGYHAHKKLTQIAIPVKGSCKFLLDDGKSVEHVTLDSPSVGLIIEPMIWHEMYDYSSDCVLMVLADDFYDESDYIRNYADFIREMTNA